MLFSKFAIDFFFVLPIKTDHHTIICGFLDRCSNADVSREFSPFLVCFLCRCDSYGNLHIRLLLMYSFTKDNQLVRLYSLLSRLNPSNPFEPCDFLKTVVRTDKVVARVTSHRTFRILVSL